MNRDKFPVVKGRSRIKAAADQIRIVRRERGRSTHGDSLLDSALHSMSTGNTREAVIVLEKFGQCPDLSNAHATLVCIACRHLRSKWVLPWTALKPVMKIASWATGIWQTLSTGNPINSFVVVKTTGEALWIFQKKQLRVWRGSWA